MRSTKLLTGVAALALMAGTNGALATDIGNITQNTTATNGVGNAGALSVTDLKNKGTSASVSATGAVSAVSATGINSGPTDVSGNVDIANISGPKSVNQTTTLSTSGNVVNNGDITFDGAGEGIKGKGASASISATGAASAVSATYISSTGHASFGDVSQFTRRQGGGDVTNIATNPGIGGNSSISGDGASLSMSATGAASSVGLTGINSNPNAKQSVGDIDQTTTVSGGTNVSNTSRAQGVSGISGDGASLSFSATGGVSAVSVSHIDSHSTAPNTELGNIDQTTHVGSASASNNVTNVGGTNSASLGGGITGDGASASVSASGAASVVSASFLQSDGRSATTIGNVDQSTFKGAGAVSNTGTMTRITGSSTDISGDGASVSISATGAVSAVSTSFINSGEFKTVSLGNVDQNTTNNSSVTNNHKAHYQQPQALLNMGEISGDGASVSVSATGAASAVSLTSINNKSLTGTPSATIGQVDQTTVNSGAIVNQGLDHTGNAAAPNAINTGDISGTGASASISATGAASAISVASINGAQGLGNTSIGNVTQTTTNHGSVSNTGVVNAGSLSGVGASASVSAVGAASSVSISSIGN